jgi:hypothetical protein
MLHLYLNFIKKTQDCPKSTWTKYYSIFILARSIESTVLE